MSKELKPCPFCGSDDLDIEERNDIKFVFCKNCQASTADCYDVKEAVIAWNRRASDED